MDIFLLLLFSGLETGSIYALATLGIVLIYKTSRTTNFAQGTIGMFNAFAATFALNAWGLPTWLAALFGMVSAFVTGILIDIVIIRRAKRANSLSRQIITFGLIMVLLGLTPMTFGVIPLSFPRLITQGQIEIMGASLSHNGLLNIAIGTLITAGLFFFLKYTKWGLAVRVTASNETTAKLMGVPTAKVTMGAWAVAASLGALSALMLAPAISVNPTMMENVQLNALIAGVLGGFSTFYAPVIAAFAIGIARNLLLFYVSSVWGEPILFSLILLFIVIRPNGLVGKKIVKKV